MVITLTPDKLMKFVGRKNIYAMQTKSGAYVPVRKEITMDALIEHFNGDKTLGSYVIREDGKINFAVIDIDSDPKTFDYNSFLSISEMIYKLFPEFERVLEFSGRRGFHIWLLLDKAEPPAFMRELIKTRLRAKGLINIEIYPKQDKVDELKQKLGNLVKLPCGKHLKNGKWSKILKWTGKNTLKK